MSRAQQYPRLILALVCLPVFIGALDLTIVSAVLPEVIRSLTIEIQKLDVAGWVVTGYFVSYAISMTFMGKVSDIAGRRLVYLALPGDFLRRLMARRGLARLARRHRAAGDATVPGRIPTAGFASLYALIAGRVDSGVRRRRDGAGEHGARRRSVSAREAGASARHRRRGRHRGLGAGASLRRDHGAVHELAVSVLDQSPGRRRDLLHDVVGVGRPAPHGREGRHRLDRRDAAWRRR